MDGAGVQLKGIVGAAGDKMWRASREEELRRRMKAKAQADVKQRSSKAEWVSEWRAVDMMLDDH